MQRKSNCYALADREWMAWLCKRNGNSLSLTVPIGIVRANGLRPGMKVRVTIEPVGGGDSHEEVERWTGYSRGSRTATAPRSWGSP